MGKLKALRILLAFGLAACAGSDDGEDTQAPTESTAAAEDDSVDAPLAARIAVGASHCAPNPCQNGGSCQSQWFGYSCSCQTGFSGKQCERRNPSSGCRASSDCVTGQVCVNAQCTTRFSACRTSSDCPAGLSCRAGLCL